MQEPQNKEIPDLDIRCFIYSTFAGASRLPSVVETADNFKISIAAVESAYERLNK